MPRAPLAFGLLLTLLPLASAQNEGPQASPDSQFVLQRELATWRAANGAQWQVLPDPDTYRPVLLYGARLDPAASPTNEAGYVESARGFLARGQGLFGIEAETLLRPEFSYLALSFGGSSDKVAVRFEQAVDGLPVFGASVNVLMDMQGRLLSIHDQALPGLLGRDWQATLDEGTVRAFAANRFLVDTGFPALEMPSVRLGIEPHREGRRLEATLAYEVEVRHKSPGKLAAKRYLIAARGEPRVLRTDELIHFVDVGGSVKTLANPGNQPDGPSNPVVQKPASYMTVSSLAGTTTTDAAGNFNFPGVNGPLQVTFSYLGSFNDVGNIQGADYALTTSLSGTGNTVFLNPTPSEQITSQSNVFVAINEMRDWIRGLDGSDGSMDLVNRSFANQDFVDFGGGFIITDCNAYYDGSSTNYFLAGNGCVNTGYSSVVAHEQGHWLNDRYGSFNGSDGFGEGNADVFSMYLYDSPIIGDGFFGPGTQIRSGLNTLQFCGDGNSGCYGAVHTDGQVLMGALWKVRSNLKTKFGGPVGGLVADQLLSGWMNGFDQGTITSAIEIQWLTLDDNDGLIGNGSPNYPEIDAGFRAQGFPGYDLELISIAAVIGPADTLDQVGPYGVAADVLPLAGSLTGVRVFFDAGSGFASIPMGLYAGQTFTGLIPGQSGPAEVRWYVEASDNLGNLVRFPKEAPSEFETFRVGELETFFYEGFEGSNDAGWTHAQIATQDDWQRGAPEGKAGSDQGVSWIDPNAAASGQNCWGNDLGIGNFNGAYQPNVVNYLRSPAIDLSAAAGVTLRFKRWLTVEQGVYDQATIRLGNTVLWSNPQSQNLLDTSWVDFQLPVPQASGNPAAQFEFRLQTDGGLQLGGWAIDDFELFSLKAPSLLGVPQNYGSGLAGNFGVVPTLDTAGQPARIGNSDFRVELRSGKPGAAALLGLGTAQLNLPVFGGSLLVQPDLVLAANLDLFGRVVEPFPLANNPAYVGLHLYAQAFVVDPAAVQGFAITRGLDIAFVN